MPTPPMLEARRPAPAAAAGGRADPATSVSAFLLGVCALALFLGGVLAVYDYQTPGAELPVFWVGLGLFTTAVAVQVAAATIRFVRALARG